MKDKKFLYVTSLLSVGVATSASAVEYRWSFEMAGGAETADIKNKFGSELSIECKSGNQFNIPTIDLGSKIATSRSDRYVQFVIDGKNYPVSFSNGSAEPHGRLGENAIANFVTALNDAKSKSFTAEYPEISKKESFSTLNVRGCSRRNSRRLLKCALRKRRIVTNSGGRILN